MLGRLWSIASGAVVTAAVMVVSTEAMASSTRVAASEGGSESGTLDARQSPHGAVFIDPAGFLLFGPTAGVEVAIQRFSVASYFRWLNVGLLANAIFLGGDENDSFNFSFGGGIRGRYYWKPGSVGPHLGVALEFIKSRVVDESVKRIAVNNIIAVPQIEGGYRLGFGSFFVGGAASGGYAAQIAKNVENVAGGNSAELYEPKDVSNFYGSMSVEVGLFF